MSELRCWWKESGVACSKLDWPACGYDWLINGPVSLFALVWFLLGLFMLYRDGSITTAFRFSAARIHDPLAQGIAVAMAQRKYGALQQPRLLRYVKLCAMWAEWPTFTMTPLTFAYKVAGTRGYLEEITLTFSSIIEGVELSLAILCGTMILLLHHCKKDSIQGDTILRRFAYPITFDALYIPLVSNFVRLGTCPQGVQHISFLDGSTCDCIDRFGIFWAVGLLGFLILYSSSLYYKMHIEPMGTTMDFRFETSFQIIMVMARTLNPILSILAVGLQLEDKKTEAIPITLSFLVCVSFLLQYAYRTQPCIGSGRIPNNIRVLSFSSSLYTTICVLIFLLTTASLDELYYMLAPLPFVWLASWKTNNRRALLFYIPDLPIIDLLQQRATRAKTVGTIAALYMDASKVRHADHEGIIFQLHDIAKHSMNGLPLCRIYAIRTLWFCYIRNFKKGKSFVGEPNEKLIISNELWFKDKDNPDRVRWTESKLSMRRTPIESALAAARRRVKITRTDNILDVQATEMLALSKRHGVKTSGHLATRILGKARKLTSRAEARRRTIVPLDSHRHLDRFNYHIVSIRDKHWISKNEEAEAAILHHEELHHFALEILSQCCAMDDRFAMFEIASLLLQWYRSQYLKLNKTVYAHVLSTLCATNNMKCVIDATHTIYQLSRDQVIPIDIWLNNTSFLNNFVLALGHPSQHTVYQCAQVLLSVIELASKDEKTNLFVLLTPESITKIHTAFRTWYDSYKISQTIEDCCIVLHLMEVHHQRKLWRNLVKKGSTAMLDTSTPKPPMLQADKLASMTSTYNRSYWLSLSTNTTMLPLDATSPQVLVTRPVSSSRKSAINYGDPNTSCIPAVRAGVGIVTISSMSQPALSTTHEIASPTGSTNPSINSMILPAEQATKEVMDNVSYVPPHKTSKLSTISRIRRASIDFVSFKRGITKSPKSKAEQFVFVTSAIITEIERRQALRKRFEQELQRTYYQFEDYLMKPALEGPAWLMDDPKPKESSRSTMTFGRRQQNNDVVDGFEVVMEIYTTAEECALHDFIETQLDRDLLSFFENHIKPFMTNGVESGRSRWRRWKEDWPNCGYKWLTYLPIALLCLFWLIYGLYMLLKECRGLFAMQFEVSRIHDPLAQGIAVALSQRKESIKRRSRLQHNMKLCAMWAEWPSLTYAPVSIAFKVANSNDFSQTLFFSFNVLNEPFNISVVLICGIIIAVLKIWKASANERILRGFVYPIAFDVLYIPIASTCLRLAVCPTGYERIALPGGATCDCIDRYGLFWACGLLGFILIYSCALHYKMYIEPTNTTLDFRFQTSFQVVMVMARTLNPLLSMLGNCFELSGKPMNAVPIMICFLLSIAFLLCYAYKTQPCIGSGRLPNNIRVITFSSSLYTSLCVLLSLIGDFSLKQLYISLLPLPVVWLAAWHFNTKRASCFHIPSLSILELLREPSIQAKTVGVIAVLYADPVKIRQVDHEPIIECLEKLITTARTTELLCRIYSLRVLWFSHIESFRKAKSCVGESCEVSCLSFRNWCKDRLNPERIAHGKSNLLKLRTTHQKLVKICRVENIVDVNPTEAFSGIQSEVTFATTTFKRIISGLPLSTRRFRNSLYASSDPCTSISPPKYHIVKVKHKNWIAKEECVEAAVVSFQSLYNMGVDVLNASCALDDRSVMQEAALFLLQWYRARYLRLNPAIFLHISVVLCASNNFKFVIDAVHTVHKLVVEGILPLAVWQHNPLFLNLFALALDHSSAGTIDKCVKVLAIVLEQAEDAPNTNIYTLLNPSTVGRIHTTFYKWSSHYGISESIERLCMSVYCIQLRCQQKHPSVPKKPTLTRQMTKAAIVANWAQHVGAQINATLVSVVASSAASVHSVGASISRRVSHRHTHLTNQRITSIKNLQAIDNSHGSGVIHPIHAEIPHSRLASNKRILPPSKPSVPEVLTSKMLFSQFQESTTKPSLKRYGSNRDLSVTKLRFHRDAKQGPSDRFTFITPDIIAEIQRRCALRKQFSDLLSQISITYAQATTERHGERHCAMSVELMQNYSQLLTLYSEAEECAMQHFVATAIDEKQRDFFDLHVRPFIKAEQKSSLKFEVTNFLMPLRCYLDNDSSAQCTKVDWPDCGYTWLVVLSFTVIIAIWILSGVYLLRNDPSTTNMFRFDVAKLHDPVEQGIAIALSQHRNTSLTWIPWQRYFKLCGMWMEWPSFTYTPLVIAYSRNQNGQSTSFGFELLDYIYETFCLTFAVCCGLGIISLQYLTKTRGRYERILRQIGYPITFDLLYIPFISTFARLAMCPVGYVHLPLPGGATCDCINRFGITWALGTGGFVLLYTSALHYKMYIEPTGTAMEFRFQTSFQIIMVMARTLNPILAMLASDFSSGYAHTIVCFAMFGLMSFLLVYSYKTQPCIGSGRIANNIRVLTFTSSAATSLCVGITFVFDATITQLHYVLSVLPLIWLVAWHLNHRKASPLNIPNLSILELLQLPSKQAKTVAVIAALYVDAIKVCAEDYDAIVSYLQKTVKLSRNGELLSRVYAIRFLWYCHVESFIKAKTEIGEPNQLTSLPPNLWLKDRENPSREEMKKAGHVKEAVGLDLALNRAKRRVKIRRIDGSTGRVGSVFRGAHIHQALKLIEHRIDSKRGIESTESKLIHSSTSTTRVSTRLFLKTSATTYKLSIKVAASECCHLIKLGDKHWISKKEPPEEASFQFVSLYHNALEILAQSCAMGDKLAMHEIAILLLQWYQTRYLRLSPSIYLHVLTTLCATNNTIVALDATHTLHKLSLDGTIGVEMWLKNPSYLNNFILSLRHPSPITVLKCAQLVAHVLKQAENEAKTNIFVLITPDSIGVIHSSFYTWQDHYCISEALERICASLYTLERSAQSKRIHEQKARLVKQNSLLAWAHRKGEMMKSIVRSADSARTAISTRFAQSIREFRAQGGISRRLSISGQKSVSRRASIEMYRAGTSSGGTDEIFSQGRSLRDGLTSQFSTQSFDKNINNAGVVDSPREPLPPESKRSENRLHVDLSHLPNEPSKLLSPAEPRLGQADIQMPAPRKPFESILHKDFQLEPGLKNLQLVFVTPAILTEIDRRHSLRCQFEMLLHRTRSMYEEAVRKPGGIVWLTTMVKANSKERVRFKRNQHPNHEIIDGFSRLIEMFKHSQGCAMEDFVKTGLDAELSTFFEGHIKPFAAATLKPSQTKWKFPFVSCLLSLLEKCRHCLTPH